MNKVTPAVMALVAINVGLFVLNSLSSIDLNQWFGLYFPDNPSYGIWQYLTSMFMHAGIFHLLFNMLGLWMFGSALEQVWGSQKFLFFYFAAGLGAGVIYTLVNQYQFDAAVTSLLQTRMTQEEIQTLLSTRGYRLYPGVTEALVSDVYQHFHASMVGASGALYGVLVAFAMRFPNVKLALLFIPFPIAAKYFIPVLLSIDLFSGITGFSLFGGGIAHFAHLGGALIGFTLMLLWRKA